MNQLRDDANRNPLRSLHDLRLAVLIDADNISHANIKGMIEEVTRYGTPTFKRIYGDWTQPSLIGWKKVLLEHAITPIQQYGYTKGKNATDSAMIIDAMDILYSGKVDGFCIISSDSDFTRLAVRLREAGMRVIGMGERKTPNPFIVACEKFIYIEVISEQYEENSEQEQDTPSSSRQGMREQQAPAKKKTGGGRGRGKPKIDKEVEKLIRQSVSDVADEDGWAFLGEVGTMILKKQSSFDPRNYGFNKLTPLLKALDIFEFDERHVNGSNVRHIYVRDKND